MEQQSTLPLELDELERLYNRLDGEAPTVSMDCSRDHLTLLELLESEPASNNFVERLKKHHDLLELLQSTTNGEYTVLYHTTALKDWPNLPTLLRTGASNRRPVLRSSFGSSGWWINRCNRIVKSNMVARNGIAHLIQRPCPPPPSVDSVVQGRRDLCFASEAIRQLNHEKLISTTQAQTLFLPSDKAFEELGSDVLNFLSKTEQGRPYMLALLKLHILPQVTVFCNFIWPKNDTEERWTSSHVPRKIKGKVCYTFASLASDKQGGAFCVTVAFYRFRGLVSMLVNQFARVTSQDHCAMNGAVHVIDRVLLPVGDECATNPGSRHLTVDQLREVLAEYI